jgi:hypothetical protein
VLLFTENIAAFAWRLRNGSRRFVEMAVLALVLNAIAQYGPAYVQLDRWIQIGTIGAL